MSKYIAIFIFSLALWSCIEPIEIEVSDQTDFLVVDGLMTTGKDPFQVKLSRSSSLDTNGFRLEQNAIVHIEAEGGERVNLTEQEDGVYLSAGSGLEGIVGKQYRLLISTNEGKDYASEWVSLKETPSIDSVYFRYEEVPTEDGLSKGMQIYLDAFDPENKTRFYRWDWTETWMYRAPYATPYEYIGNDDFQIIPAKDICWKDETSSTITIGTSLNNEIDIITEFPLLYISTESERLRLRYSILVKQYALTEKEYLFWKSLQEANELGGTLFDRQPQSTVGNVRNIENPDEAVLGYFSASAASEKRIFIDRIDMPRGLSIGQSFFRECLDLLDTIPKSISADQEVFQAIAEGKVFYDFNRVVQITGYILTTKECSDCREQGGRLEKPEFWID